MMRTVVVFTASSPCNSPAVTQRGPHVRFGGWPAWANGWPSSPRSRPDVREPAMIGSRAGTRCNGESLSDSPAEKGHSPPGKGNTMNKSLYLALAWLVISSPALSGESALAKFRVAQLSRIACLGQCTHQWNLCTFDCTPSSPASCMQNCNSNSDACTKRCNTLPLGRP